MLIINNDLYIRSKEDIVAVRPDTHEIMVYLVSDLRVSVASSAPVEDAMRLSKEVFARYPDDDPNEVQRFTTTSRSW